MHEAKSVPTSRATRKLSAACSALAALALALSVPSLASAANGDVVLKWFNGPVNLGVNNDTFQLAAYGAWNANTKLSVVAKVVVHNGSNAQRFISCHTDIAGSASDRGEAILAAGERSTITMVVAGSTGGDGWVRLYCNANGDNTTATWGKVMITNVNNVTIIN